MRDLDDVLAAGLDAREQMLRGASPAALDPLVASVRRRRARRATLQGVGAAVVVAALATVGWWGLDRPAPEPAVTPSPTVSPSPAPTRPSPTPTTSPSTPPPATSTGAAPTTPAGLPYPAAPRVTEAVLRDAGPGWGILAYGPAYLADGSGGDAPSPWEEVSDTPGSGVYVTDPDGRLFLVTRTAPEVSVSVHGWTPGSSWAFASQLTRGSDDYRIGRLDLLTGRFEDLWVVRGRDDEGWAVHPVFLGPTADGSAVFEHRVEQDMSWSLVVLSPSGERREFVVGADPEAVDPSGNRVVGSTSSADARTTLTVVELGDGTTRSYPQPRNEGWCRYLAWFDATDLVVACGPFNSPTSPIEMWRVPVGDGAGNPVLMGTVPADPFLGIGPGWGDWVRDGTIVVGTPAGVGGLFRWDGRELHELLPFVQHHGGRVLRAAGRAVVVAAADGNVPEGSDGWGWGTLTAVDVDSGATTVLAPPVASTDGRAWTLQVTSWAFG